MIAMTIFGMMSVMVMTIYFSTTATTRKLDAQRQLAESAREIVERISEDVREHGFSGSAEPFGKVGPIAWTAHNPWLVYDYSRSGSEYLNLNNGRYVYGKKNGANLVECINTTTENRKTDPRIHCGLYFIDYSATGIANGYNLVDSFTPDESKKRVKIANLAFYISGDGI
jgi:type II secretory pathway pseudopilin PulG